jgi:hypothetical protein
LSKSQSSFPLFDGDIGQLEKRPWEFVDELRANSNLSASEYLNLVLDLAFLRYADRRFTVAQQEPECQTKGRRRMGVDCPDSKLRACANRRVANVSKSAKKAV